MPKRYEVDRGCSICRTCVYLCPAEAITMDADGAHINQDQCSGCGKCFDNCPSDAISVYEIPEKTGEMTDD